MAYNLIADIESDCSSEYSFIDEDDDCCYVNIDTPTVEYNAVDEDEDYAHNISEDAIEVSIESSSSTSEINDIETNSLNEEANQISDEPNSLNEEANQISDVKLLPENPLINEEKKAFEMVVSENSKLKSEMEEFRQKLSDMQLQLNDAKLQVNYAKFDSSRIKEEKRQLEGRFANLHSKYERSLEQSRASFEKRCRDQCDEYKSKFNFVDSELKITKNRLDETTEELQRMDLLRTEAEAIVAYEINKIKSSEKKGIFPFNRSGKQKVDYVQTDFIKLYAENKDLIRRDEENDVIIATLRSQIDKLCKINLPRVN